MATCAEKIAWLTAAEAALQRVTIGGQVTVRKMGEKQISYSAANLQDLQRYVLQLRDEVAACSGDTTRLRRRRIGLIPLG